MQSAGCSVVKQGIDLLLVDLCEHMYILLNQGCYCEVERRYLPHNIMMEAVLQAWSRMGNIVMTTPSLLRTSFDVSNTAC
jgi:hypothetical protein